MENPIKLIAYSNLEDRKPVHAEVKGLDLVIIRFDDKISVLYGRCLHRGALLADGYIDGDNLIFGDHNWDYRYYTGVSEYNNEEVLHKFSSEIKTILFESMKLKSMDFSNPILHLSTGINYAGLKTKNR